MRLFTVIQKLSHLWWSRAFSHSILTAVIIIGRTVISMLNLKIGGQDDDTRPTRTADRALRSKRLLRERGLPFTEQLLIVRTKPQTVSWPVITTIVKRQSADPRVLFSEVVRTASPRGRLVQSCARITSAQHVQRLLLRELQYNSRHFYNQLNI